MFSEHVVKQLGVSKVEQHIFLRDVLADLANFVLANDVPKELAEAIVLASEKAQASYPQRGHVWMPSVLQGNSDLIGGD